MILRPWVEVARAVAHPELTRVMEDALEDAESELARAALERLREA
jgi:hypothetical protein